MITIAAFIPHLNPQVEHMMLEYGKCRRRGYQMKSKKGLDRNTICRSLVKESGIPARYIYTAYDSVKGLPAHVTFGGQALKKKVERGIISASEYKLRRNNILTCRGEKRKKGNLCLRIFGEEGKLRVTIGTRRFIELPIYIPKKFRNLLAAAPYYNVCLRRRNNLIGYDVRIAVPVEFPVSSVTNRLMTLDTNAGHLDFAITEKSTLKAVVLGRINCNKLLFSRKEENKRILHLAIRKISNIAKHYGASSVVAGKIRTSTTPFRKANRKIHRIHHWKMRQALAYKLPQRGLNYWEQSEAYTTVLGRELAKRFGVDVHKGAAYAFSIKVINFRKFNELVTPLRRRASSNEGDGIPITGKAPVSELTVPCQKEGLACSAPPEATPQHLVEAELQNFKPNILRVIV